MKWSAKIDEAIEVSAIQHQNQKRRNGINPYIVHPFTVAWMVSEYTDKENTIIAALLHDVIEDTDGYGVMEVERDFGTEVAQTVGLLSKNVNIANRNKISWMENKIKHLEKLREANNEVLLILIMDHLHNAMTMAKELVVNGENYWIKFNGKKEKKYELEIMYYQLFVERKLPEKLCNKMRKLITEIYGK